MNNSNGLENMVHLKNVDQIGIVVRDMEAAMKKFSALYGVRTWYKNGRNDEKPDVVFYKGKQIQQQNEMALGYCGSMQLELVQSGGTEENIYTTHLENHGEGIHHLGFFVPDLEAKLAAYAKLGIAPVQTCELYAKGGAVTRCAYLDNADANGITIELVETRMFGIHMRMKPILLKIGAMMGDLQKVRCY